MNPMGVEPHWLWLLAAAAMAIAEMLVPGIFLIWIAAAAAVTGLLTLAFGIPVLFQLVLFALSSMAAVYAGRTWYQRHPVPTSDPLLNDRTSRLVGETVIVVGAIVDGRGRVRVGDGVWACKGPDSPEGTRVRVVGAQGTCLTVVRAKDQDIEASELTESNP
jgi:membrane protein implicated in regulation of membrane protease activity